MLVCFNSGVKGKESNGSQPEVSPDELQVLLERATPLYERLSEVTGRGAFGHVIANIGMVLFPDYVKERCAEPDAKKWYDDFLQACEKVEMMFEILETHPDFAEELLSKGPDRFSFLKDIKPPNEIDQMLAAIEEELARRNSK